MPHTMSVCKDYTHKLSPIYVQKLAFKQFNHMGQWQNANNTMTVLCYRNVTWGLRSSRSNSCTSQVNFGTSKLHTILYVHIKHLLRTSFRQVTPILVLRPILQWNPWVRQNPVQPWNQTLHNVLIIMITLQSILPISFY